MKVVKLKISLLGNDFKYFAEAIEDNGQYYYKVGGIKLKITQYEYDKVIINPYLYYFSTALRLHFLIQKNIN